MVSSFINSHQTTSVQSSINYIKYVSSLLLHTFLVNFAQSPKELGFPISRICQTVEFSKSAQRVSECPEVPKPSLGPAF